MEGFDLKKKYNTFLMEREPGTFKIIPTILATVGGGLVGGAFFTFSNSLKTTKKKNVIKDYKPKNIYDLDHELPNDLVEWQKTFFPYIPQESQEIYKKHIIDVIKSVDSIFGIHLITLDPHYKSNTEDALNARKFSDVVFRKLSYVTTKWLKGKNHQRATELKNKIMKTIGFHIQSIELNVGLLD